MQRNPMRSPLTYADLLRTYLRPHWRSVLALAGLLAVGIALQLANPKILSFFSRFVVQIFGAGILLIAMLFLLVLLDPPIGGAITLSAAVSVAILLRMRNLAVPAWAAERQAHANLFAFLEEYLAGTEDLRS